ncbi:hypothetical protein N0V84_000115 [Fusarium piperis]|uniref:Uncharacterized protein n=1 Tax=Fusarium piperis TaxID=1435070 RepID=A0A9W9BTX0_9HYPO|nr:hypothetical protein N0V84_000115 [Fusarium piperis]
MSFIVNKRYDYTQQELAMKAAVGVGEALGKPKAFAQEVVLISTEMVKAMKAFFAQTPSFTDVPRLAEKGALGPPYTWWYHRRKSHNIQSLPDRQARLVLALVDWIESAYASLFEKVDDQLRRDRVSCLSMPFFLRPGDILVSGENSVPRGYVVSRFYGILGVDHSNILEHSLGLRKTSKWLSKPNTQMKK